MEVDVDGSLSYPEPQTNAKDTGKCFYENHNFSSFSHWIEWVGSMCFLLGQDFHLFFFFFLMVSILFMLADKHSRSKPLNIEEEQYMRVFYENKLQEVCNNFHFPHKIQVCVSLFP